VTAAPPRRAGAWPKGVSGNPSGRRKGVPNRPKEGLDELLRRAGERHGKHLVNALVGAAKAGDVGAAGALLNAIVRAGEAPPP
jgi:hypothetical protein